MVSALPHVSSNRFSSILDIMRHTFDVVQALEHTRLSDTLTRLHVTQVQQAETVRVLETTQLKKELADTKKELADAKSQRRPALNTYTPSAYAPTSGPGFRPGVASS